jgi:hypothetical protein
VSESVGVDRVLVVLGDVCGPGAVACRPMRRMSRCTRLRFNAKPSRRSQAVIRRLPKKGVRRCFRSVYSSNSSQNNPGRICRIPPPLLLRLPSRDYDYRRSDFAQTATDEKRPFSLPSPGAATFSNLPLSPPGPQRQVWTLMESFP